MLAKNLLMTVFASALAMSLSSFSQAEENPVIVVGKVSLSTKSIEFTQQSFISYYVRENNRVNGNVLSGQYIQDEDYSASLPALELSLSAIYGNFYLSVTAEETIQDDSINKKTEQFGYTTSQNSEVSGFKVDLQTDTDISRSDFSITAGYRATSNINLFGGYKFGRTTADETVQYSQESDFEEAGLYAGASYAFRIDNSGTLSFSVALARMSMDKAQKTNNNPDEQVKLRKIDYEGDANGLSLAVAWSAPLTDNLQYGIALKQHNYQYDADGSASLDTSVFEQQIESQLPNAGPLDFSGGISVSDVEAEIAITTLYASLNYVF